MSEHDYIAAIDQGTTSTRCVFFKSESFEIETLHQVEHTQYTPSPGWLEHDPSEIYINTCTCINEAYNLLMQRDPQANVLCFGITNQRETTVAWSRSTGRPLCKAIVWSDLRTEAVVNELIKTIGNGEQDFFREFCGLPFSTYFSAVKMVWMLRNVKEVKDAAAVGDLMFGTIDAYLVYFLNKRQKYVTDVSNASRTMLMNIKTRKWDFIVLKAFGIPINSLPEIHSNVADFGKIQANRVTKALHGVLITGMAGDQQASLVGHMCFTPGQAKNTYGTGCFMLVNIGTKAKPSRYGLLTTIAYQAGDNAPCYYAFEGSVAAAGATQQWLRDKLNILKSYEEIDSLALDVPSSTGVVFVPSLSGYLAPYWRPDARGTIFGLTLQTTKGHIIRAALEGTAMQVWEIKKIMEEDANLKLQVLRVDGGLTKSVVLMQTQANYINAPVNVAAMQETTALGAAMLAGIGAGVYKNVEDIVAKCAVKKDLIYECRMGEEERDVIYQRWKRALSHCFSWTAPECIPSEL